MIETLIVIPARFKSQRFPGKVLYPLIKKPVLQWVYEAALKSKIAQRIIIATEDKKVIDFAKSLKAEAMLTSEKLNSGSDRVWEAAKNINAKYIVNLQADEPFIDDKTLKLAFLKLKQEKDFDISTACAKITDKKDILNPNCVKIAMTENGNALYFSRSPIPYHHELSPIHKDYPYYKHCGFYIYKKSSLKKFIEAKPSKLEILERLEQLRALENKMKIKVVEVKSLGPAIDTLNDIKEAEKYYKFIKNNRRK